MQTSRLKEDAGSGLNQYKKELSDGQRMACVEKLKDLAKSIVLLTNSKKKWRALKMTSTLEYGAHQQGDLGQMSKKNKSTKKK